MANDDEKFTHDDIMAKLEELEEQVAPIVDAWEEYHDNFEDVAALARSGRIVGKLILWLGGLVAAIAAISAWMAGRFHG